MRQDLLLVNGCYALFRFELDDYLDVDEQVGAIAIFKLDPVPNDWDRRLPLDVQTSLSQFVSHHDFIHRL